MTRVYNRRPAEADSVLDSSSASMMIDYLKEVLEITSDAKLCERLHIAKPTISKIRHGKLGVSATLLLAIHDETGIEIKQLKRLLGIDGNFHYRK